MEGRCPTLNNFRCQIECLVRPRYINIGEIHSVLHTNRTRATGQRPIQTPRQCQPARCTSTPPSPAYSIRCSGRRQKKGTRKGPAEPAVRACSSVHRGAISPPRPAHRRAPFPCGGCGLAVRSLKLTFCHLNLVASLSFNPSPATLYPIVARIDRVRSPIASLLCLLWITSSVPLTQKQTPVGLCRSSLSHIAYRVASAEKSCNFPTLPSLTSLVMLLTA